ncbi:MAG: DsrE family protein [Bacillota bacterium]
MKKVKVLFHLNDPGRWPTTLQNIGNLLKNVGQRGADVVVVANGSAVVAYVAGYLAAAGESAPAGASCGLARGGLIAQMRELAGQGVKFTACRNSLQMQSIAEDALPSFVLVVPAGVTEIARKQADGYAYIKP